MDCRECGREDCEPDFVECCIELLRERAAERGGDKLLTVAADALEAAREDLARLDWLSQHDVGICHLGHGDYQWYSYAIPKPEHGMLGLRAAIDQARGKGGESNESMDH